MRLAILETGAPPPALIDAFGAYATMTRALIGCGCDVETIRVAAGDALPAPDAFAAYVVTGSAAGAYDPLPWIPRLEAFLREAAGRTKLVGICFGHQIIAQAFGGHVAKAPQGWALGLHHYDIAEPAPWMDAGEEVSAIRGIASHQDQVLSPPPGSRTLASSAFTKHAILDYGHAISFQFHPEFSADFSRALFARRRTPNEAQIAAAIASLDGETDNARVAGWIGRFLRG